METLRRKTHLQPQLVNSMKYLPILLLACFLNYRQKTALLLALIVGLGAIVPIPKEYGALVWYSICAVVEILIIISALKLQTTFSIPIISLSTLFVIVHYLGWTFDGYPVNSPYHYFAKTLGFTELFTCAILSNPVLNFVKGKLR